MFWTEEPGDSNDLQQGQEARERSKTYLGFSFAGARRKRKNYFSAQGLWLQEPATFHKNRIHGQYNQVHLGLGITMAKKDFVR